MKQDLKVVSGGSLLGVYPVNDAIIVELSEYNRALLSGDTEKAEQLKSKVVSGPSIYAGDSVVKDRAKAAAKEVCLKVVAVPIEYAALEEKAKCLPGNYLVLQENAPISEITIRETTYGVVFGRHILAVCDKDIR